MINYEEYICIYSKEMLLIEQNLVQFFRILRVQFMEHEELFMSV